MRIIAFQNSVVDGISGGNLRFIEVANRMHNVKKTIVTSLVGQTLNENKGLDAEYFITTREDIATGSIAKLYFNRITRALSFIGKTPVGPDTVLYTTSEFFPDVIPAFILKVKNPGLPWIAFLHLIAPNPFYGAEQMYLTTRKLKVPSFRGIAYKIMQLISLGLMRWKADLVSVDNQEMVSYLKSKGFVYEKLILHENGIDLQQIRKVIPKKTYKIYDAIFLGRFHPQKGLFDLIHIWRKICDDRPEAMLAIIGSGSARIKDKLEQLIAINNLQENIIFLGLLPREENFSNLKCSKILLFPSFHEGSPNVMNEAMACGVPVVAYDLPAYNDDYKKNIICVPLGNMDQFAREAIQLIEDREIRDKISTRGLKFMRQYDWTRIAEEEAELLISLTKGTER